MMYHSYHKNKLCSCQENAAEGLREAVTEAGSQDGSCVEISLLGIYGIVVVFSLSVMMMMMMMMMLN